ncbi:cysteine proteinase [Aspergillus heteromorphus CBS 117.55]|uniref:ubiquitinyl hydrolase 1 n=1 Tax=Aspergillus heteromorphus CBS 117.55 TaxID=1448321 RepID=A0A317WUB2_9EURO|nr:cysteine proteinase [Aspergillus heteromorphus CBS 117.55]PWY90013.1 cysteine proteinase [Aspergillus heteromorphus CBS 117.55]
MADGGGWSTIESDEGVFTSLIENLGVKDVQFEELISLDADTIRSLSLRHFTTGFPPDLLGEALSNSEPIRTAHNAFARSSPFVDETARQNQDDEGGDVYHFIAYTPVNGTLYELDGLQPHPISHGGCTGDEFPEKVIGVLRERIARYPEGETRFNLMAVVRDLRVAAREIGDAEALEREERKRRGWAWENTLRRSNFVGFIGEVLKGVVGGKDREGEGAFEEWVGKAREETQRKLLRR